MGKKKRYYVVVRGYKPGVYTEWSGATGAAEQIGGFSNALYKGFYTADEAITWLEQMDDQSGVISELISELSDLAESPIDSHRDDSLETLLEAGKVVIYTDGGAIDNPGPGGYGVVLRYKGHRRELSGGYRLTTNNRMELLACIEGLQTLNRSCEVTLFSDSKYVVDGITQGWARNWRASGWKRNKAEKAENVDLWDRLLDLCDAHDVEFRWVRGHAGDPDNERCHQLATEAAQQGNLPPDTAYEAGKTQIAPSQLL